MNEPAGPGTTGDQRTEPSPDAGTPASSGSQKAGGAGSSENAGSELVVDEDGVAIAPGNDGGTPGTKRRVVDALRTCFDPEIPVNIYDLGMIYRIDVDGEDNVHFVMTLTSPACPVAGSLPPDAERRVAALEGVRSAKHELVWDPPWNPDMMHEAAKLELGFYDEDE